MTQYRVRRLGAALLLLLLLPVTAAAGSASSQPFTITFDSTHYSETIPLYNVINDGEGGALRRGDRVYTDSLLRLSYQYDNWGIAYINRYRWLLSGHPETFEFAYQAINKKPLDVGRRYRLQLDARQYWYDGMELSRVWQTENWDLTLRLALIRGRQLNRTSVNGFAQAEGEQEYSFAATAASRYSEDFLFERPAVKPQGWGYAVAAKASWRVNPEITLRLLADELWGQIHWSKASFTDADFISDTAEFDDDGYVEYRPVVSGVRGVRPYRQEIRPRGYLAVDYKVNDKWRITAAGEYTANVWLPRLGLGTNYAGADWVLHYYLQNSALKLERQQTDFSLSLGVDHFNYRKLRQINLGFSWRLP